MNPATRTHEIIVVDDESTVCEILQRFLNDDNFSVTALTQPQEAVPAVIEKKPCLVILDVHMPGMNGLDVLKEIKAAAPGVPVVVISGDAGFDEKAEARRLGACDVLAKPVDWRHLRNIANLCLFLKDSKK